MPDEKPNVKDMDRRQYAAAKAAMLSGLLATAPRYRQDAVPVPMPTTPDGTLKPISELSRGEYEAAKAAVRKSLMGFAAMGTTPGLDESTKR